MDKKIDIKNARFELVNSTLKGCKEVEVVFNYNGEDHKYFIFVDEGKNTNYINEAKKQFNQDVKSGKVLKSIKVSGSIHYPWLIATVSVLGIVTLTLAGLFTWKALTNSGGATPTETNYIVTFESNGGSHVDIMKVKAGTAINEPTVTKTNYTFDGWYEKNDWTGEKFNFSTPINKDYTFYAKWIDDSNYVSLVLDAGEGNTIEGTKNKLFKYYVEKGTTFGDAFKTLHYVGGASENNDFLYWTINNQPIDNEYVIDEDVNLVATYKPALTDCLTITARQDDLSINFNSGKNLKVSTDHTSWGNVTSDAIVLEHAGDQIYIKREETSAIDAKLISSSNKSHSVSGFIESLVNGQTSGLAEATFEYCFQDDSNLVAANNLNLGNITLVKNCFRCMFSGCSSLTSTPSLPATTVVNSCYERMFEKCSSLTTAPALPAETLDYYCYAYMFENCTALTAPPAVLPAVTLKEKCYASMFHTCTSLTTVPEICAETLHTSSCEHMFHSCTSLTVAPELPATDLADYCYYYMFNSCTSLITPPSVLPATALKSNCYGAMFENCGSLAQAPEIRAETSSGDDCCDWMFSHCKSLKIREETGTTTGENKIFTCPSALGDVVQGMFNNTGGTFTTGTPTSGNTYYWYK